MSSHDLHNKSEITKICLTCGEQFKDGVVCPIDRTVLTNAKSDPLIGTIFAGRYEIMLLLGRRSTSTVYLAKHTLMDRLVAIRTLVASDTTNLKRFQDESRLISKLKHENILKVFDFGVSETGQPFMVMDYLEGATTLGREIAKNGPLPLDRAVRIFCQACDALNYAHDAGLVHRDLKPSNFMLIKENGEDVLQLVDFAISKPVYTGLNISEEVLRNPNYLSPEQCLSLEIDSRSDIFSLGCVMYETLTGKAPLLGATPEDTIRNRVYATPRAFASVDLKFHSIPEQIETIVFKCLKHRDLRYQSVEKLWTDLVLFQSTLKPKLTATNPHLRTGLRFQQVTRNDIKAIGRPFARFRLWWAFKIALTIVTLGYGGATIYTVQQLTTQESINDIAWIILTKFGQRALAQGYYPQATRTLKAAGRLAATGFGPDDPRLSISLNNIGTAFYKQDLYPEAEKRLKQALAMEKSNKADEEEDANLAKTMNVLGSVYVAEGRFAEAEPLLRQALKIRHNLDPESEEYAESKRALAAWYNKTGGEEQSFKLLEELLNFRVKLLGGPDHPDIAETENSLAIYYQNRGDYDKAKSLYKAAKTIASHCFNNEEHPLIADSLVGLGSIAYQEKEYTKAEKFFDEALAIREKALGKYSLRVGEVLSCLGIVKNDMGDYTGAATYLKRSLQVKEIVFGSDSKELVGTMRLYSEVLRKVGRAGEADGLDEQADKIEDTSE